uniref:Histone deacetylase complex subunit SAP30 Sin3 binding domain-containing protein n=1 Tax=Ciona savignyi TaxID=51511 RepID=H2Y675_CIOSA
MPVDSNTGHGSKKRKRKESAERERAYDPLIGLEQLQMNTLRRYKKYYKLQTRQGLSKAQLVECVYKHFINMQVNEKEALAYFIYMVKMNRNRWDNKEATNMNNNNNSDENTRDNRQKNEVKTFTN